MKCVLFSLAVIVLLPEIATAQFSGFRIDAESYVERAEDIVIGRFTGIRHLTGSSNRYPSSDVVPEADFEILRVLKGSRPKGNTRVACYGRLEKSRLYLLRNGGGKTEQTSFIALDQLSVVEIPPEFDLSTLDRQETHHQVRTIFAARKSQIEQLKTKIERQLRLLQMEQQSLTQAVGEFAEP